MLVQKFMFCYIQARLMTLFSTERLEEIEDRRHTAVGSANHLQKGRTAIQHGEKHLKNRKQKDKWTKQMYKAH